MKDQNESNGQESGGDLFLAMPTGQAPQSFGCFDVERRVQWLLTKRNPLSRLAAVLDWEQPPAKQWSKPQNRPLQPDTGVETRVK